MLTWEKGKVPHVKLGPDYFFRAKKLASPGYTSICESRINVLI